MSANTIVTTEGVSKTITAQNNEGFFVKFTKFSISDTAGAFDASRTAGSENTRWLTDQAISSYRQVSDTQVELTLTVPTGATAGAEEAVEIYLYAEDQSSTEFLFSITQPSPTLTYDPVGLLTVKLSFNLSNAPIGTTFTFDNTVAQELAVHNTDQGAHPFLIDLIEFSGAYNNAVNRKFAGQNADQFPEFDGGSPPTNNSLVYKTASDEWAALDVANIDKVAGLYTDEKTFPTLGLSDGIVVLGGIVKYEQAVHVLDITSIPNGTQLYINPTSLEAQTSISKYPLGKKYNDTHIVLDFGGSGSGQAQVRELTITGHGLDFGDQVYGDDDNGYFPADSSDGSKLRQYTVVDVIDVNTVTVQWGGVAEKEAHGFTVGQYYFQDPLVPGEVTTTDPLTTGTLGTYSCPAFHVISDDQIQVLSELRPVEVVVRPSIVQDPIGKVSVWLDDGPIPSDYLELLGQDVSRTAYPDLFALWGEKYGAGDGVNTFTLPAPAGYFLRVMDGGAGIDQYVGLRTDRGDGTTGDNVGTKQGYFTARPTQAAFVTNTTGSHTHSQWAGSGGGADVSDAASGNQTQIPTLPAGNHSHSITAGGDAETAPVNFNIRLIVRAVNGPSLIGDFADSIAATTGPSDGNKVVRTDPATGLIHPSFIPQANTYRLQRKYLASNVSNKVAGAITSLTFNNLTVGKSYRVIYQVALFYDSLSTGTITFNVRHNGNVMAQTFFENGSGQAESHGHTDGRVINFVAEATTVEFHHNATITNYIVFGDGSNGGTWVEIEERPDINTTTAFT